MPEAATSPLPDDPALLRIEGPIATITLNRPGAFNSVNLAIAQKLEQLAAEVEGKPLPTDLDFPTIDDGVEGMAFIETVVKSSKAGARWVKFPRV